MFTEVGETRVQNRLVSSKGVVLAVEVAGLVMAMMERWGNIEKSVIGGR